MKIKLRLYQVAVFLAGCCFIGFMIFMLQGCSTEELPPPIDDTSDNCINDGVEIKCVDEEMTVQMKDKKSDNTGTFFGDHSGD
jgi:starvation-inducible outer membrane lipoprotein